MEIEIEMFECNAHSNSIALKETTKHLNNYISNNNIEKQDIINVENVFRYDVYGVGGEFFVCVVLTHYKREHPNS